MKSVNKCMAVLGLLVMDTSSLSLFGVMMRVVSVCKRKMSVDEMHII